MKGLGHGARGVFQLLMQEVADALQDGRLFLRRDDPGEQAQHADGLVEVFPL